MKNTFLTNIKCSFNLTFTPCVPIFRLEDGIQALEKEANIDFCRSMNRIIFDKIIEQDNSTFAFVAVPHTEEKPTPYKGTGSLIFD